MLVNSTICKTVYFCGETMSLILIECVLNNVVERIFAHKYANISTLTTSPLSYCFKFVNTLLMSSKLQAVSALYQFYQTEY